MSLCYNHITKTKESRKGFTIIEGAVATATLSIVGVLVFVALDPATGFAKARNAERWQHARSILAAVLKYSAENGGNFPETIDGDTTTVQVLGISSSGCEHSCTGAVTLAQCLDLRDDLKKYISPLPFDPLTGTPFNTDFYINKADSGRLTVGVCDPELGVGISVTR